MCSSATIAVIRSTVERADSAAAASGVAVGGAVSSIEATSSASVFDRGVVIRKGWAASRPLLVLSAYAERS